MPTGTVQCPLSRWYAPASPRPHRRPSSTSRDFGPVSLLWGRCSFPLGLGARSFVCALQNWSLCFPQSSGDPIIKCCWPSRPGSLGFPVPMLDRQARKPDTVFRIFTTVCELLWYYSSPVCGSPTWWVWDLISLWLHPSYHLAVASSSLDVGYLLFVDSGILLSMVVQQLVAVLVLSQEEMRTRPSTPPSWNGSQVHDFNSVLHCGFAWHNKVWRRN